MESLVLSPGQQTETWYPPSCRISLSQERDFDPSAWSFLINARDAICLTGPLPPRGKATLPAVAHPLPHFSPAILPLAPPLPMAPGSIFRPLDGTLPDSRILEQPARSPRLLSRSCFKNGEDTVTKTSAADHENRDSSHRKITDVCPAEPGTNQAKHCSLRSLALPIVSPILPNLPTPWSRGYFLAF